MNMLPATYRIFFLLIIFMVSLVPFAEGSVGLEGFIGGEVSGLFKPRKSKISFDHNKYIPSLAFYQSDILGYSGEFSAIYPMNGKAYAYSGHGISPSVSLGKKGGSLGLGYAYKTPILAEFYGGALELSGRYSLMRTFTKSEDFEGNSIYHGPELKATLFIFTVKVGQLSGRNAKSQKTIYLGIQLM